MDVDYSGFDILMAEQFLHSADIISCFEQAGGEVMAEGCGLTGLLIFASFAAGWLPDDQEILELEELKEILSRLSPTGQQQLIAHAGVT